MCQTEKIEIVRLSEDAQIPEYAHQGDSGCDLRYIGKDYLLFPKESFLFETGLSISLPLGLEAQIRPKSGRAIREGLTILNTPGTVDSSYKGEIKVILYNAGSLPIKIKHKEKIAQMVICPVIRADFKEISLEEFQKSDTSRGDEGFGSTGI